MKNILTRSRAVYAENRAKSLPNATACEMLDEKTIRTYLVDEVSRMYPNSLFFHTLLLNGNAKRFVDETDEEGNTLLHTCAWYNHSDILLLLLHVPKGRKLIDAVNEEGKTALLIALEQEAFESARILIENGANLHIGKTPPLIAALKSNGEDIARLLIEYGCDIHAMESFERTSLAWAIEKRMIDLSIDLIARGAKPEEKDFNGDTALIKACKQKGCERIITALIDSGADIYNPNKDGRMPVFFAESWIQIRHPELMNRKGELKESFEEGMESINKNMEEIWTSALNKQ